MLDAIYVDTRIAPAARKPFGMALAHMYDVQHCHVAFPYGEAVDQRPWYVDDGQGVHVCAPYRSPA